MKRFFFISTVLLSLINAVLGQIPTEGLVGYWPFDGNCNDSFADYDLVVNGAITYEEGILGQSVRIQNSAFLSTSELRSFYTGLTPFTISFWYKTSSLANWSDAVFSTGATGFPGFDLTYTEHYIQSRRFEWGVTTYVVATSYDPYPDYYSYVDGLWHNVVATFNGTATSLYVDGKFIGEIDSPASIGANNNMYFGVERPGIWPCNGNFDDALFYSRALTLSEVESIYAAVTCSDTIVSDTINYFVSDIEFQNESPITVLNSTDSLSTTPGGCDSIINHYFTFIYDADYYTDTLTVTDSISVTDTLIIDAVLTGINPPDNINTLKVYPNPASDYLIINTGDYTKMDGYKLHIINQLGSIVFETFVEDPLYEINLSDWTGKGLYYLKIIDTGGSIIDTRKIILQ